MRTTRASTTRSTCFATIRTGTDVRADAGLGVDDVIAGENVHTIRMFHRTIRTAPWTVSCRVRPTTSRPIGLIPCRRYHDPALRPEPLAGSG
jgi:hypothetical protein